MILKIPLKIKNHHTNKLHDSFAIVFETALSEIGSKGKFSTLDIVSTFTKLYSPIPQQKLHDIINYTFNVLDHQLMMDMENGVVTTTSNPYFVMEAIEQLGFDNFTIDDIVEYVDEIDSNVTINLREIFDVYAYKLENIGSDKDDVRNLVLKKDSNVIKVSFDNIERISILIDNIVVIHPIFDYNTGTELCFIVTDSGEGVYKSFVVGGSIEKLAKRLYSIKDVVSLKETLLEDYKIYLEKVAKGEIKW